MIPHPLTMCILVLLDKFSSSIIFLEYLVNTESSRYDYLANIFNVKYDIYTNKLLQNTIVH